jgi:alpha-glucoside transport system permease protein
VILPGLAFAIPAMVERIACGRRGTPLAKAPVSATNSVDGVGIRRAPAVAQPRTRRGDTLRGWGWLMPVLLLVVPTLLIPMIMTIDYSFRDAAGETWVGLANYQWTFSKAVMPVLATTMLWVILFPTLTVGIALALAVMINERPYEKAVRSILVLPAAISTAAAALTWETMYAYAPAGRPQIGLLNAVWTMFGNDPVGWLANRAVNNYALITIMVWAMMGVALVILSAAVKQVPKDLVEAARLDGARSLKLAWHVILPLLWPSVLTVLTTEVILALKIFDIIYVLTHGNNGTDVVAHQMYLQLFTHSNLGRASAIAVLLLLATAPIIWLNLRHMRKEMLP